MPVLSPTHTSSGSYLSSLSSTWNTRAYHKKYRLCNKRDRIMFVAWSGGWFFHLNYHSKCLLCLLILREPRYPRNDEEDNFVECGKFWCRDTSYGKQKYLRQFCLTHPEILYFYSILCHKYILGFFLNQIAPGSEKVFESTVTFADTAVSESKYSNTSRP